MKLLVFGKNGQVARELARRLPAGINADFLGRDVADLAQPAMCARAITLSRADAVINAAAWTAVDRAESEEEAATLVNGEAPAAMACACAAQNIPFLHISTDYVFDGAGERPFHPEHEVAPLSAYGRSKLAGEIAVRSSGARHIILRTSWVFSVHGVNFVKTMLRLGKERDRLIVIADQIGGPTPASSIADALLVCARGLIEGQQGGTYHFAGEPETSWAGFARYIMSAAGLPCSVEDIKSSEYPTPARRPLNSRLDCSTLLNDFGVRRPDWRAAVHDVLAEVGVNN